MVTVVGVVAAGTLLVRCARIVILRARAVWEVAKSSVRESQEALNKDEK